MNLQQAADYAMKYFDRYDIPAEYLMSDDYFELIVDGMIVACIDDEFKYLEFTLGVIRGGL